MSEKIYNLKDRTFEFAQRILGAFTFKVQPYLSTRPGLICQGRYIKEEEVAADIKECQELISITSSIINKVR